MIIIHLRNGEKLEVSNKYSLIEEFIYGKTGNATVVTDNNSSSKQYLVRKDAIDYVEKCEED